MKTLTACRLCSGPLPEQPKLDAVVARLQKLSPTEILALSVKSGIHLPGGGLAPEYRREAK